MLLRLRRAPRCLLLRSCRVDAELAVRGYVSPLVAVVVARAALEQDPPGEARAARVASGARALVTAGAPVMARELCARAREGLTSDAPGGAALALCEEQIARDVAGGSTRAAFAAAAALAAGEDATALFAAVAEDPAQPIFERRGALEQGVRTARERHDFASAVRDLLRIYDLAPKASDAVGMLGSAALAAFWGGDLEGVRSALARAAATMTQSGRRVPWIAGFATKFEAGARAPEPTYAATRPTRAKHEDARGVLEGLASRFALGSAAEPVACPGPSAAHAAFALTRAGVATFRAVLSPALVECAMRLDLPLLLEEERPTTVGLRWVVGWEKTMELLLLEDLAVPGAVVVPLDEQRRRSTLVAQGTLLVLGRGDAADQARKELAAAGLADDATLRALDGCEVDADGETPPPQAARRVLEPIARGESPPARALERLGALLMGEFTARRVEAEELLSWYVTAREKFPDTEWAVQTYAAYLERTGRTEEAAIAWSEAQHWDPADERNVCGRGRALERMGRSAEAKEWLLRATMLAPKDDTATFWLACTALSANDVPLAEVAARVATEQDPEHPGSRLVLADALERRGDIMGARTALEKAHELSPGEPRAALRLARGHVAGARWEEAREMLAPFAARRAMVDAARAAAAVAWAARPATDAASSDREAAKILIGALRERPDDVGVLGELAKVLYFGALEDDEADRALLEATTAFDEDANGWGNALMELGRRGLYREAALLFEPARAAIGDGPQSDWLVGRTMLYAAGAGVGTRGAAAEVVARVADQSPGFEWPNVFAAAHFVDDSPERALTYAERVGERFAAAGLEIQARALERLGRASDAAEFRARQNDLPAAPLCLAARRLSDAGFCELARAMIQRAATRFPERDDVTAEELWQASLAGEKDVATRLAELAARGRELPWRLAVGLGSRSGRWDLVVPAARRRAEAIARSTLDDDDPWVPRAVVAGGELAVGEEHSRRTILEACPRHPDVLAVLVRIERRASATPTRAPTNSSSRKRRRQHGDGSIDRRCCRERHGPCDGASPGRAMEGFARASSRRSAPMRRGAARRDGRSLARPYAARARRVGRGDARRASVDRGGGAGR